MDLSWRREVKIDVSRYGIIRKKKKDNKERLVVFVCAENKERQKDVFLFLYVCIFFW